MTYSSRASLKIRYLDIATESKRAQEPDGNCGVRRGNKGETRMVGFGSRATDIGEGDMLVEVGEHND